MSMTAAELQAKLDSRTNEVNSQATEQAQIKSLEARLRLIESDAYKQAKVREAEQQQKVNTLEDKLEQCEAVTVSMPIINPSTRVARKWNQRYVFEFGRDIELLYRLASGIRYSVREHKETMLEITQLSPLTIDQFLDAMGQPAYYHQDLQIVVAEKPYDVDQAINSAMLLGEQLGLALDTTLLTKANFKNKFANALNQAETSQMEAEKAPATSFTMD